MSQQAQQSLCVGRQGFWREHLFLCCWKVSCSPLSCKSQLEEVKCWNWQWNTFCAQSLLYFQTSVSACSVHHCFAVAKELNRVSSSSRQKGQHLQLKKNLHFLPITHFGVVFPAVLLVLRWLKGKPFLPAHDKLFTWSKNPHTCPCRRPLVSYEVWTKVSSCGIFSQWEFNSEHSAPFVSHWSASMGFRLFPFKHLNK